MKVLTSASKLVLLLFAVVACVATLIGKLDTKDFMVLASMVFGFYFSFKGDMSQPYAGK